jgi:hypothetical protein
MEWVIPSEQLDISPSRQDGVPEEKETRYRYDSFRYIEELQKNIKLFDEYCIHHAAFLACFD